MRGLGNGAARIVHVCAGKQQQRALPADRPLAGYALKAPAPRPDAVALCDRLQHHKTDIVAVADVARSRMPGPTRSNIGFVSQRRGGSASLLLGRSGGWRRGGAWSCRRRGARSSTWSGGTFRRRAGSGSRGGSSRSGSSSFRRRLHLFRIARRRHHRDQGDVPPGDHADALRQRDIAQVLGVVDFKAADVDSMAPGMASARQRIGWCGSRSRPCRRV